MNKNIRTTQLHLPSMKRVLFVLVVRDMFTVAMLSLADILDAINVLCLITSKLVYARTLQNKKNIKTINGN